MSNIVDTVKFDNKQSTDGDLKRNLKIYKGKMKAVPEGHVLTLSLAKIKTRTNSKNNECKRTRGAQNDGVDEIERKSIVEADGVNLGSGQNATKIRLTTQSCLPSYDRLIHRQRICKIV